MDLALALVEEDHGSAAVLEIARQLVLFVHRPGGQSQFSVQLEGQAAERHPIRDAQVTVALAETGRRPATVLDLAAMRGGPGAAIDAAVAGGAAVLVCDAETDADLERAVRSLLLRPRPLLLVGSTGLARALRRVLGSEQPARRLRTTGPAPLAGKGVLVVAGSAHPATRAQIDRARERGLFDPIVVGGAGTLEIRPGVTPAESASADLRKMLDRIPQTYNVKLARN